MTDQLSLTQKWLRQNIQAHTHKDLVYNHVDAVLTAFPTLRPKTDVYTFDDGRSQLLLCVHGLLPISFRHASYNIPIALWLPLEYPVHPPLVYVVPTSDMLVKASKFVDVSGICRPPYIQSWQSKSEGCNLRSLVEALAQQFSQEPPVFAKPKQSSPPPRPRNQTSPASPTVVAVDYSTRPPPVAPSASQGNGHIPLSTGPESQTPPRPTPTQIRPPTQSPPPIPPYPQSPRQNVHNPPQSVSSTFVRDPHVASPAQSPTRSHVRSTSVPVQGHPNPYFHPQSEPVPPQSLQPMMPTGGIQPHLTGPPPLPPGSPHPPGPVPPPSFASPPPQPVPQPQPVPPPAKPQPTRNLLEEEEDESSRAPPLPTNAPPRPPNPEILRLHAQVHAKIVSELAALEKASAADTERMRAAQADLLAGEPAIRDEMARLEAVRDVCRVVAGRLRATVEGAEANVNELRRKGDTEVDELFCSTTIVYNQLIDLVAEDNAIEDAIYHLHRALNAGRIDLDKFLRTTRSLAEEQFMKRALAQKIVTSIPLGAWR